MLESKLQLKPGEILRQSDYRTKGPLQETEITSYVILNAQGEEVGTVVHTDHTAIKGFKRTESAVQKDAAGKVVVEVGW
jgi:hypothetical protein